ncbi:MAG: POTRA domain-containing protein, partial [Candidatus Aminicenantes bacterium]
MMKRYIVLILLVFIPFSLFGQEVIEEIEIIGNDRVTKETIKYYLSSQEGDFYSPELLRKDFRVLWATGFFSNIRMEEKMGEYGGIGAAAEAGQVIADFIVSNDNEALFAVQPDIANDGTLSFEPA